MEMMIANGIVYGGTVSVAYPEDFIRTVRRARSIKGPKFIHAYSLPFGLEDGPTEGHRVSCLAVRTGMFPSTNSRKAGTSSPKRLRRGSRLKNIFASRGGSGT